MDDKTLIARRVALELCPGNLVNLGIGLPTLVAAMVPVCGFSDRVVRISGHYAVSRLWAVKRRSRPRRNSDPWSAPVKSLARASRQNWCNQ